jgi:circadian clock protein KaiB
MAGNNATSKRTITALKKFTEEYFEDEADIEIIDLMENPQIAIEERIRAVPLLVRTSPEPTLKLIGDLSDLQKVLRLFNLNEIKNRIQ